jgi:glucose uptake protein GlcU
MIANLIGGFVSILVGVSLINPISAEVQVVTQAAGNLTAVSSWGATVLRLVPGFFALGVLGIGLAVTYASLRQAGVL